MNTTSLDKVTSNPPTGDTRARQTRTAKGTEIIKQRIRQNIYASGQQLPSLRVLSDELHLSVPALQRAIRHLEKEGMVETRHGVGTIVTDSEHCQVTPLVFGFVQPYYSLFSHDLQHIMEDVFDKRSNLCFIKSTRNDPQREHREISRLIKSGVNGLLIWPVEDDHNIEFLQDIVRDLPVVFVDRTLDGVQAPAVVLDYENGARNIIRHLRQIQKDRLLVVCDPSNISSFNQLKTGLTDEAGKLGIAEKVTVLDYPVTRLIENYYQNDYASADSCYSQLVPLLQSGQFDAIFCPQGDFFEAVFFKKERSDILLSIDIVRLTAAHDEPDAAHYQRFTSHVWVANTSTMLVKAVDLIQDMTLARRAWTRTVRVPLVQRIRSHTSGK